MPRMSSRGAMRQKDDQMGTRPLDHFSRVSGRYARATHSGLWDWWRRRERATIMAALRPRAGERLLDAGCGAGYYAEYLAGVGAEVMATDLSLPMAREVRRRLPAVPTFVADLAAPPLRPCFDGVLCAGALEFCPRPARVIRALGRLLLPGGRLVLMLPTRGIIGSLYRAHHRRNGLRIHLFSRRWILRVARAGGLRVVEWRRVGFNLVVRLAGRGGDGRR